MACKRGASTHKTWPAWCLSPAISCLWCLPRPANTLVSYRLLRWHHVSVFSMSLVTIEMATPWQINTSHLSLSQQLQERGMCVCEQVRLMGMFHCNRPGMFNRIAAASASTEPTPVHIHNTWLPFQFVCKNSASICKSSLDSSKGVLCYMKQAGFDRGLSYI